MKMHLMNPTGPAGRIAGLRTPLLLMLGALLAWDVVSGQIYDYIHANSVWLVAFSAPILVAMALVHARHLASEDTDRIGLALIALAVAIGLLVPPRPLQSAAIDSEGSQAMPAPTAMSPRSLWQAPDRFALDSGAAVWDLRELIRVTAADPSLRGMAGQRVSLEGFVYRRAGQPSDEFLLSRFIVRCCTADAMAFSFPVHDSRGPSLARDTWVQVTGAIREGGTAGAVGPFVEATLATVIPQPSPPYLYP
jgi:putative membrane protein